jgi:hypothetical protein
MADQPVLGFAGLLRQLRAGARLTQEELAEAAGLSPRSVIAGEPRAGKLARGVRTGGRWKRTRLRRAPRQRPTGVQRGRWAVAFP